MRLLTIDTGTKEDKLFMSFFEGTAIEVIPAKTAFEAWNLLKSGVSFRFLVIPDNVPAGSLIEYDGWDLGWYEKTVHQQLPPALVFLQFINELLAKKSWPLTWIVLSDLINLTRVQGFPFVVSGLPKSYYNELLFNRVLTQFLHPELEGLDLSAPPGLA